MHQAQQPEPVGDPIDGLVALLRLARLACGADQVLAVDIGADGIAVPVAAEPPISPPAFPWPALPKGLDAWPSEPAELRLLRLPSSVVLSPGRPARRGLVFDLPLKDGSKAAIVLLWTRADVVWTFREAQAFELVRPAVSEALVARHRLSEQMEERFRDLFESVPLGIVVIDGSSEVPLVNGRAASLLGLEVGLNRPERLAVAMRALRERCNNADELARRYDALQADIDYSATLQWRLGPRVVQVDTHPVLGDGRNGRIWLFDDITAQHRLEDDLRRLAEQDALTGIGNRRAFEAISSRAFVEAGTTGASLALLMVDIDHFKSINDRYGHAAGDEVLQQVAGRLRGVLRESDVVARIGGEEFACLLRDGETEALVGMAERLRLAIAVAPVVSGISAIDVHISVGIALRGPADVSVAGLLERADKALYDAKRSGRNRVVMAD